MSAEDRVAQRLPPISREFDALARNEALLRVIRETVRAEMRAEREAMKASKET